MILCVGEILADMIGCVNKSTLFYERKAGGAPFNVACAAEKLGARVGFIGSVGDDIIGNFLYNFAAMRGFDYLRITKKADVNTTLAFVDIDERGEREFCFYRKNTADYMIPEVSDEIINCADIVHIGSLMLSEESGLATAIDIAERTRAIGKLVSFDVNFRTDIFRDRESALKSYKRIIAFADILKFSEDEMKIFGSDYIDELSKNKLVCISLGADGSEWHYHGKSGRVGSIKIKPADTTGAGDAFYGGVLFGLDGLMPEQWTEQKLNEIFKFANVCGALNTLGRGAIDNLPDIKAIKEKLKEL